METILFALARTKSLALTAESFLIPLVEFLATGRKPPLPFDRPRLFLAARKALDDLLLRDVLDAQSGVFPKSYLMPQWKKALQHGAEIPSIVRSAFKAAKRKKARRAKDFSSTARRRAKGLPAYYQRNFHFQEDGYLGEQSAALYDHQVDLLFAGAADPMRRMVLRPLHRWKRKKLKILEIGCGRGSATHWLRAAFPQAEIVAVDLSEPYLTLAQQNVSGVKFQKANGEKLPFKPNSFDAVVSVFLFHELPLLARKNVLKEARRVCRSKGILAYVDSLQLGDSPDLDEALLDFPKEFHEPFYPNYLRHPMTKLLQQCGWQSQGVELGFFSRMEWALKKA